MTSRDSTVSRRWKPMEMHGEWSQLCCPCSAGSQVLLLENSIGSEERATAEEHSHLSSLLTSKACYFAQQLHYYLSIIFGREFRKSYYRFKLYVLSSHWAMEMHRRERKENYVVLSKRNFVLNHSICERYDH